MEKTKYQSLLEKFQQAQDRIKEVEESREALREVLQSLSFDLGITKKGEYSMLAVHINLWASTSKDRSTNLAYR